MTDTCRTQRTADEIIKFANGGIAYYSILLNDKKLTQIEKQKAGIALNVLFSIVSYASGLNPLEELKKVSVTVN